MRMNRRNVLVGLGTIVAGGGAALGTGAFSQVEADRTAAISVADDADAFLGLEVHEDRIDGDTSDPVGNYVSYEETDGQNVIQFHFDGSGNTDSTGLNVDAVTQFDNLITITNDSTNEVDVTITPVDTNGDEVTLGFTAYEGTDPSTSLGKISSGDPQDVGFEFDLTEADASNAGDVEKIEITADEV